MIMDRQRSMRIQYGGACHLATYRETLCEDGIDNDEDCLTDGEDPDCRSYEYDLP